MPERHILLVADRTAAAEALLEAARGAARRGAARFHLVVPATPSHRHHRLDPRVAGHHEAHAVLPRALTALRHGTMCEVTGRVGPSDPVTAVRAALAAGRFDEIIISTLPARWSTWCRGGVPTGLRALGLPVTHVEAAEPAPAEPCAADRRPHAPV